MSHYECKVCYREYDKCTCTSPGEQFFQSAKEAAERRRQQIAEAINPKVNERTGTCHQLRFVKTNTVAECGGKIVERTTQEFRGDPMHLRIGGRNPTRLVRHGFHCTKCGAKYEFIPPDDIKPETT